MLQSAWCCEKRYGGTSVNVGFRIIDEKGEYIFIRLYFFPDCVAQQVNSTHNAI